MDWLVASPIATISAMDFYALMLALVVPGLLPEDITFVCPSDTPQANLFAGIRQLERLCRDACDTRALILGSPSCRWAGQNPSRDRIRHKGGTDVCGPEWISDLSIGSCHTRSTRLAGTIKDSTKQVA
jgi:hypothetical protein